MDCGSLPQAQGFDGLDMDCGSPLPLFLKAACCRWGLSVNELCMDASAGAGFCGAA